MGVNTKFETKQVTLSDVLDTLDELEHNIGQQLANFSGEKVDKLVQDVGRLQGVMMARLKLQNQFGGAIASP